MIRLRRGKARCVVRCGTIARSESCHVVDRYPVGTCLLQSPRIHFDAAVREREEQTKDSTVERLGAVAGGANPLVGGQC
jgi:hypothetical protein